MDKPFEEAAHKPSVYVVVAYRWGTVNNHRYNVTATTDRAEAITTAEDEANGRGGKYGVEVVEYPAEMCVAYFPSSAESADAAGPQDSGDLAAAHYIGVAMLSAFQSGSRSAPSGQTIETPGGPVETLTQVRAEFPSWIGDLCQHALDIHRRGK